MTAPPRYLSPFVRTRTRLSLTLGLVLAALTAALLPWWQPDDTPPPRAGGTTTDVTRASTAPRDEVAATAEAARTGKQVLVDTATTATALTWALPDGQFKTRITAAPTRAKNAAGAWAPVDNKLRRTAKAPRGLGVTPANPVVPVRFASGTARKARADRSYARAGTPGETLLAEVDLGAHTVAYTWPGALPEPVLDGPRALYPEVLAGVDLLLVAREEGGMAQVLIVKTPEAARQEALRTVTYGLRSDTAVFRQDRKASRVRVLDKAGKEVGSIPTPFAWDSSGRDPELPPGTPNRTKVATTADVLKLSGLTGIEPGAHSAPLPITLDGENTHDARLGLGFAATGLAAREGVTYPLFVDPPLNPGWDAWTVAYKPYPSTSFFNGTNFSSGTSEARVGHESDTGGTARSFWRMDWNSSIKGADDHQRHLQGAQQPLLVLHGPRVPALTAPVRSRPAPHGTSSRAGPTNSSASPSRTAGRPPAPTTTRRSTSRTPPSTPRTTATRPSPSACGPPASRTPRPGASSRRPTRASRPSTTASRPSPPRASRSPAAPAPQDRARV